MVVSITKKRCVYYTNLQKSHKKRSKLLFIINPKNTDKKFLGCKNPNPRMKLELDMQIELDKITQKDKK
jgi:hypothetical protein